LFLVVARLRLSSLLFFFPSPSTKATNVTTPCAYRRPPLVFKQTDTDNSLFAPKKKHDFLADNAPSRARNKDDEENEEDPRIGLSVEEDEFKDATTALLFHPKPPTRSSPHRRTAAAPPRHRFRSALSLPARRGGVVAEEEKEEHQLLILRERVVNALLTSFLRCVFYPFSLSFAFLAFACA
jgi:hypothetical protein